MNKRFLLITLLILVLIVGYSIFTQRRAKVVGNKTYSSPTLNFEITYPQKYEVEEKFASVVLSYGVDHIQIDRSGTNFEDLPSALSDLDLKNNSKALESENIEVNGVTFFRRLYENPGKGNGRTLVYFVYEDYQVFSLQTTSPDLYDDLEQIAKSFRYTGK